MRHILFKIINRVIFEIKLIKIHDKNIKKVLRSYHKELSKQVYSCLDNNKYMTFVEIINKPSYHKSFYIEDGKIKNAHTGKKDCKFIHTKRMKQLEIDDSRLHLAKELYVKDLYGVLLDTLYNRNREYNLQQKKYINQLAPLKEGLLEEDYIKYMVNLLRILDNKMIFGRETDEVDTSKGIIGKNSNPYKEVIQNI